MKVGRLNPGTMPIVCELWLDYKDYNMDLLIERQSLGNLQCKLVPCRNREWTGGWVGCAVSAQNNSSRLWGVSDVWAVVWLVYLIRKTGTLRVQSPNIHTVRTVHIWLIFRPYIFRVQAYLAYNPRSGFPVAALRAV
jgi:hypothetical protein